MVDTMRNMKRKSNWLKARREELDLKQGELVARLQISGIDVSQSTLSNWETGRYQPPLEDPDFRRELAKALRMSVHSLLIAAGYEVRDESHSEAAARAAFIIDQLEPDQQKIALNILEQFIQK